MTLFLLLLVLAWERLFKLGSHWQIDNRFEPVFRLGSGASLFKTVLMVLCWMGGVGLLLWLVHGLFFGVLWLVLWVLLVLFCVGAGEIRRHYRAYLRLARKGDVAGAEKVAATLALIHGLPSEFGDGERLRELQNALVWINFRFYLAPLFWLVAVGSYGPVVLSGYAMLRAYQTWLTTQASPLLRPQSGVDAILHCLDWIPVRLVGLAYALLGHGERALPAWLASLGDIHSSQYQVLTRLAQFSLAGEPHGDIVKTPRAAVVLARKITLILLVIVSVLTIYGALI